MCRALIPPDGGAISHSYGWRSLAPSLFGLPLVAALREDVRRSTRHLDDKRITFLHGSSHPAKIRVHWSIDRHADVLYDMAREPYVVALAERLVGKAVVPLRADYVLVPANEAASPWRQLHSDYEEHFGNEPAAAIWMPLLQPDPSRPQVEFATYPGREILSAEQPEGGPAARYVQAAIERAAYSPTTPTGGAIAFDSYCVWRFCQNQSSTTSEGVLLHYRGSPYRERRDHA